MKRKYEIDDSLTGVERTRARKLAYYYANKDKVQAYREGNKEQIAEQRKQYRAANADLLKAANAEWRARNAEYNKAKAAEWRSTHPERNASSKKAYYEANREQVLAKQKQYAADNAEAIRAYHRARYKQMPELYVSAYHRRRARKLLATPQWDEDLTDLVFIEGADLVRRRKNATGIKWHVDHIVPLSGKFVSGLHVWNNLQVIPASVNLSKANAFRG